MDEIGIIGEDRLKNIPQRYRAQHEFCFHLHDLMAGLLIRMETEKAADVSFNISPEEKEKILEYENILDYLSDSGREEIERRVVINHICNSLFADMLHFIYESLKSFEKRKFTVAYSLLRKPLKEGLLLLSFMCADEKLFFQTLKNDSKSLLNRKDLDESGKRRLISQALEKIRVSSFTTPDYIYDTLFNFKNDSGMSQIFDKATHFVTEYKRNQTENYNINFIFKNPLDNDVFTGETYQQISTILLFIHTMQITLYERMASVSEKYTQWMIVTSIGAFEAIFLPGRPNMVNFVNSNFGQFMNCPHCGEQLRVQKRNAARFFISERMTCRNCGVDHHFPFGWLLSKMEVDISG
ncbi:hypothetical protein [Martelella sp. FOR1707]